MSDSTSLKVFKCPTCGAPLDPTPGMAAMKCPYCNATVVIPETLRSTGSAKGPEAGGAPASLSDVTRLAKEGKLEEAAKIYSKITGLSGEYAMMSVKSMAGIRDDEPPMQASPAASRSSSYSPGPVILNQPQTSSRPGEPFVIDSIPSSPIPRRRNRSCLGSIINLVVLIVILTSVFPSIWRSLPFELPTEFPFKIPFLSPDASIIPAPFAKEVFAFRPRGLDDPRAIGVDGSGNIVVSDFDGETQVYDPAGNLINSFKPETEDGNLTITNIAVSREGVIYIPADTILMYDINGNKLGEVGEAIFFGYESVALGPDNTVHASTLDSVVRFDQNGQVDLTITEEKIAEYSSASTGLGNISVDSQGNIYFWGPFDSTILKFSPSGEFLAKFGGENTGSGFSPGKFVSPHQIAFDGYGRMYVVDFFNIQVLDANGNYLDKIEPGYYGAAFDAQNNLYGTTAVGHEVVKMELKSPGEE
jgi:DNA-directed RNA polymerase subunit RPC12/RpoP